MVALPVLFPKQSTSICAVIEAPSAAAGCAIVTLTVVVAPLASFTVHVQVPAGRLIAVALFCTGLVFQL